MNTNQNETYPVMANRPATAIERENAAIMLRSFGQDYLANRVEHADSPEDQEGLISVVSDFNDVTTEVVLVPPGTHDVPADLLQNLHYFLGMSLEPKNYPTLILQSETSDVVNSDTGDVTPMIVCHSCSKMMNLNLYASKPTVIERYFSEAEQFSDAYINVNWMPGIDGLNSATFVFYNGWPWALTAYGKDYRGRNTLEKSLDAAHTGTMNAIDGVFRPLVKLGEKLDQMLGLK